ncbi:Permease of the major facilitator superfamily [Hahella chejuensis KCTC 2396]|uniref:Permease of the major facilitator superfamily n=1 Tax=Hahella chejuensis (strain KCTC 2396) TaxID=349521 RepID=Q2SDT3_HAHCH|nr:MDR family MFS transporter [Hahella chejuensis]ABC31191.1 Permease of the major facilitator superfamily [Hahella chejuensis KCTC 2396]
MSHKKTLLSVSLLIFLGALEKTIVTTPLPVIGTELNAMNDIAWVVTAYLLTATSVIPICGKLSDLFGRLKVIIVSLGIFCIGSLLCALATDMQSLILSRALQGVGGGALISLAFVVISDVIPAREIGRYQGYISAIYVVSNIAGPVFGSLLTEHLSWRWIFAINIPLTLLAAFIAIRSIKDKVVKREDRFNWGGSLLLVSSTTLLILLLSEDLSLPHAFSLVGALFIAGAWTYLLTDKKRSVVPRHLFKLPNYAACILTMGVCQILMTAALIYFPLQMQVQNGVSLTLSGYSMLLFTLGVCVSAYFSGKHIAATGAYKTHILVGFILIAVAFFLMLMKVAFVPLFPVIGLGIGFTLPGVTCAVQNVLPAADRGVGISFFGYVRELSGAAGVVVCSSLYRGGGSLQAAYSAFGVIYLAMCLFASLAFIIVAGFITEKELMTQVAE